MGAPFTLGIGRQHVVPPQPPKLFSIRVYRVHPPNPPQGGLSCSLLPFAVIYKRPNYGLWVLAACAAAQRKASFQQTTWPSQGGQGAGQGAGGRGQGAGGRGAGGRGQGGRGQGAEGRGQGGSKQGAGEHRAGQEKSTDHPNGRAFGVQVIRGAASLQSSCTGRLYPPSPCCRDARPGASVEASSAHANGQRRSRQFRV